MIIREHASSLPSRFIPCLLLAAGLAAVAGFRAPVWAQPAVGVEVEPSTETADGYCDFVLGTAAAQSALAWSPELFGNFGYIDQQTGVLDVPEPGTASSLRLTAGLRYSLSGIFTGLALRNRAEADCRRQRALSRVRQTSQNGEQLARRAALLAQLKVLEGAQPEAGNMLRQAQAQFQQRNIAAPELLALRLRVDDLAATVAAARREVQALPPETMNQPSLETALHEFYDADAEVERREASLRRAESWDFGVRFGYDQFLEEDDDRTPLFGVVSLSYNLGGLWMGLGNSRSAAGRRRYAAQEGRRLGYEEGLENQRLASLRQIDQRRKAETEVLRADLEAQFAAIKDMDGELATRFRQTLWFDLIKIRAEDEYLRAHLQSLASILGEKTGP